MSLILHTDSIGLLNEILKFGPLDDQPLHCNGWMSAEPNAPPTYYYARSGATLCLPKFYAKLRNGLFEGVETHHCFDRRVRRMSFNIRFG